MKQIFGKKEAKTSDLATPICFRSYLSGLCHIRKRKERERERKKAKKKKREKRKMENYCVSNPYS